MHRRQHHGSSYQRDPLAASLRSAERASGRAGAAEAKAAGAASP